MADLSQVTVPGKYPGTTLISEGDGPTGLFNNGPNPASLSFDFATQYGDPNKSIPLAVNQWLVLDGTRTVYAMCATNLPTLISVLPGGVNFFNPSRAVASAVISATAPSNPKVNDLWFNSSNGNILEQWNGSAWVPFQWGTGSIAVASITSSLIAAGTIVAGIVNGTTITGATLIADGANGGVFVYSGVPATGNLIATVTPQSGTDGNSNTYLAGITSYSATVAKQLVNMANGVLSLADGVSITNDAQLYTDSSTATVELDGPTTSTATFQAALRLQSGTSAGSINAILGSKDHLSPATLKIWSPQATGLVEGYTAFTLQNSFTAGTDINGTSYPPQFKKMPHGTVRLAGELVTPASGTVTALTFGVIPAAYRPTTNTPTAFITNNLGGQFGVVYIRPNGNVQLNGTFGNSSNIRLDCEIDIGV